MPADAGLEISLYRRDAATAQGCYGVEVRFSAAGSAKEKIASGNTPLCVDDPEFHLRSLDPAAYGLYLAGQLLADPPIADFFQQAHAAAQSADALLHIRLHIRPDASELHTLRWETLRLPGDAAPLLTGQNVTFSRYLDSRDWRPVPPRSADGLRALIVVADPANAGSYGLAPVQKDRELAAAHAYLGDLATTELATQGQVTLAEIGACLRDGCDILYLIAHGMLKDGAPWLFLDAEDGAGKWIAGQELATRIFELDRRPRLAVLVSCQGAGTGNAEGASEATTQDNGALAGLGPQLAGAGVPAVIAMQGNFSLKTAAAFVPVLLRELRRDGSADRAMSSARGDVRDRPDWWMPVLFTCLEDARVWTPDRRDPNVPVAPDAQPQIERKPFEPETVYVPAGPFLMGSNPGEGIPAWETPLHPVTLPGYRIGKYPVTHREYAEFIRKEKGEEAPKDAGWFLRKPPADKLDHPVSGVSWRDAVAYCRWLSRETGRAYRLPSEAEWEKAAAGGGEAKKRRYPWGDAWDPERCHVGGNSTAPVTGHPSGASPYGCEDMLGNVQEWTATLWGTKVDEPGERFEDNPEGGPVIHDPAELPLLARMVHRGGSYRSLPAELRCSARTNGAPDSRLSWRGFRVAMEVAATS